MRKVKYIGSTGGKLNYSDIYDVHSQYLDEYGYLTIHIDVDGIRDRAYNFNNWFIDVTREYRNRLIDELLE